MSEIPNKIWVYEVGGEEPMIWDRHPLNEARYGRDLVAPYYHIPDELIEQIRESSTADLAAENPWGEIRKAFGQIDTLLAIIDRDTPRFVDCRMSGNESGFSIDREG